MSVTAKWRGHPIWFDEDAYVWRFEDDGSPVADSWTKRPCGHCGELATKKGHDRCIANLPGVVNACCGHGEDTDAYVMFENGVYLQGDDAMREFRRIQCREET